MSRLGATGRLKKGKGLKRFFGFLLLVLFLIIAAAIIAAAALYSRYVAPHIGGVSLMDSLSLIRCAYNGKNVQASYSEQDLDDFYTELAASLFIADKDEVDLQYELLDDAAKAALEAEYDGETTEQDALKCKHAKDVFRKKSAEMRYAMLGAEMQNTVPFDAFCDICAPEWAELRAALCLKLYPLSAKDIFDGVPNGDSAEDAADTLQDTILNLSFNFASLKNYDETDPNAIQNADFSTLSISGKQVAAFMNDIITLVEESEEYKKSMADALGSHALSEYLSITSVTIKNTPLAVSGTEGLYNQKDTELAVALKFCLKRFMQDYLDANPDTLNGVPDGARGIVNKMFPKYLNVSLSVYPLAEKTDERAAKLKINNMSSGDCRNLKKIINALVGKNKEEGYDLFAEINDKTVSAFGKINDKIKLNFVPAEDAAGNPLKDGNGNAVAELNIMTVDTLLSLLGADAATVTGHDVLCLLKCLYTAENAPATSDTTAATQLFKQELSQKYGINADFLNNNNFLSEQVLTDLASHISPKSVDYSKTCGEMRVMLPAEVLASLALDLATNGKTANVAAAGEAGALNGIAVNLCGITVSKEKGTQNVFKIELSVCIDILQAVKTGFADETSDLITSILPEKCYIGVLLYVDEREAAGGVRHSVGGNIATDNAGTEFTSKLRINDFSYWQTDHLITVFSSLFGGEDGGFSLDSVLRTFEDTLTDLFTKLETSDLNFSIRLYAENGGGLLLPSVYEILSGIVNAKLDDVSFDINDAQQLLRLVYNSTADTGKKYQPEDADAFLAELCRKYYLKEAITAEALLSGSSGFNVDAADLNFTDENGVYLDTTPMSDLRVMLTGAGLAALTQSAGVLTSGLEGTFGGVSVLGCEFFAESEKLYIKYDVLCDLREVGVGEDLSADISSLLPENIKISIKSLLFAPSYEGDLQRFCTTLTLNDGNCGKLFELLTALGGSKFSEKTLTDSVRDALSSIFDTFEGIVPIYYRGDDGFFETNYSGAAHACVYLADVFTTLLTSAPMYDAYDETTGVTLAEGERAVTAAELRAKIQEFGRMPAYTETDGGWQTVDVDGLDGFFVKADETLFLDELNKNYYLSVPLDAASLVGEDKSFDFSVNSVNFKGEGGVYADTRPIEQLSVFLSGKALGAMITSASGNTKVGDFARMQLIKCDFAVENCGTVAKNDDKLQLSLGIFVQVTDNGLLPKHLFLCATAEISYNFETNCFPAEISCKVSVRINNLSSLQTKNLLGYVTGLGVADGEEFSLDEITSDIAEVIAGGLQDVLSALPQNSVTVEERGGIFGLTLPDVFSVIISTADIKESDGTSVTAADFATRLRAFGKQVLCDADCTDFRYLWAGVNAFMLDSDAYVYEKLQQNYFMKTTPTASSLTNGTLFGEFTPDIFNLSGTGGMFTYTGESERLRISDRALGKILYTAANFDNAVASEDSAQMILIGTKIEVDDASCMKLTNYLKFCFGGTADAALPRYFVLRAETAHTPSGYQTQIGINDLPVEQTADFFANFASVAAVESFDINMLCVELNAVFTTIMDLITINFTPTYGNFDAEDVESCGYGYMEVPTCYELIASTLFPSPAPQGTEVQAMLNKLYDGDLDSLVLCRPDAEALHTATAFTGANATDAVMIFADAYLAGTVASSLMAKGFDGGKITNVTVEQMIILACSDTSARLRWKGYFGATALISDHDYAVLTAGVLTAAYTDGQGATFTSVLPQQIKLTVLIDLTNGTSKCMLNKMTENEGRMYENMLKNAGFDAFSLSDIAADIASYALDSIYALNTFDALPSGFTTAIKYLDIDEKFGYYDSIGDAAEDKNKHNTAENLENCCGYMVIYTTAEN